MLLAAMWAAWTLALGWAWWRRPPAWWWTASRPLRVPVRGCTAILLTGFVVVAGFVLASFTRFFLFLLSGGRL